MSGIEPLVFASVAGGIGTGLGAVQAVQRNNAISKQASNAEEAARIQARQLADRRAQELDKNQREAAQLRGRLLAQQAERGGGFAGTSFSALDTSILGSLASANSTVDTNYRNARESLAIGTQSQIDQLFSQTMNPVLSGLGGGLQGALTGLQINQGYNQLFPKKDPLEEFLWSGR